MVLVQSRGQVLNDGKTSEGGLRSVGRTCMLFEVMFSSFRWSVRLRWYILSLSSNGRSRKPVGWLDGMDCGIAASSNLWFVSSLKDLKDVCGNVCMSMISSIIRVESTIV